LRPPCAPRIPSAHAEALAHGRIRRPAPRRRDPRVRSAPVVALLHRRRAVPRPRERNRVERLGPRRESSHRRRRSAGAVVARAHGAHVGTRGEMDRSRRASDPGRESAAPPRHRGAPATDAPPRALAMGGRGRCARSRRSLCPVRRLPSAVRAGRRRGGRARGSSRGLPRHGVGRALPARPTGQARPRDGRCRCGRIAGRARVRSGAALAAAAVRAGALQRAAAPPAGRPTAHERDHPGRVRRVRVLRSSHRTPARIRRVPAQDDLRDLRDLRCAGSRRRRALPRRWARRDRTARDELRVAHRRSALPLCSLGRAPSGRAAARARRRALRSAIVGVARSAGRHRDPLRDAPRFVDESDRRRARGLPRCLDRLRGTRGRVDRTLGTSPRARTRRARRAVHRARAQGGRTHRGRRSRARCAPGEPGIGARATRRGGDLPRGRPVPRGRTRESSRPQSCSWILPSRNTQVANTSPRSAGSPETLSWLSADSRNSPRCGAGAS